MNSKTEPYIGMLLDILKEKKQVLEDLYQATKLQEAALAPEYEDMESFEAQMGKKEIGIKRVEELDDGFSDLFEKVKASLHSEKTSFRPQIEAMQKAITECTDLSVKLETLEERNRRLFEKYLLDRRQQIKGAKKNSRMADAYTKTMGTAPGGDSIFLDKSK